MNTPLAGIKVLDFTRILAGPYCTMLLGDLGAEVIKLEVPGKGDDTRAWRPPEVNGQSCYFVSVNRNKKSVTLNLKSAKGIEIVRRLAARSDVLVENFLPGTMQKLSLGYEALRKLNSSLVYCSITESVRNVTGYGQRGPYVKRGGYDVIVAGVGGLMHITGPENGEPCKTGVAMTDISTGLYAYGSILAALLQRTQTGKGQHLDCNLLSTQVSTLANIGSNYLNANTEARRWGTAHESIVPYQGFRTKDKSFLVVGAGNDKQFLELADVIQLKDLSNDTRFVSNRSRVLNRSTLISILSQRFMQKTATEWIQIFADAAVSFPYGPINNLAQVFADPQVIFNELTQELIHPTAGSVKVVGPAVRFSESEVCCRTAPPLLGEHTTEILRGVLSYSDADILDLRRQSVI